MLLIIVVVLVLLLFVVSFCRADISRALRSLVVVFSSGGVLLGGVIVGVVFLCKAEIRALRSFSPGLASGPLLVLFLCKAKFIFLYS